MNAPQVPSAKDTAAEQTKSNIASATAQSNLNHVNQVTPTGSLTYTITGKNPDGTPQYTATSALSGAQQGIFNTGQSATQNLLNQIKTGSQTPFNVGDATQTQLDDLAFQRLNPQLDQQRGSIVQDLANRGIKEGTQAYTNAMRDYSSSANDARNSLILNGYTTARDTAMAQSNQPYNQLAALLGSGSGVTPPQWANTPQAGVAPTDTAGIAQNAYQQNLSNYNNNMQALGSIGSTVGGWLFSDEKLKTNIHGTGMKTPDGIPVKTFQYKGSPMLQMGVMAQDTAKVRPDAVRNTPSGYQQVNYPSIGMPPATGGPMAPMRPSSPMMRMGGMGG